MHFLQGDDAVHLRREFENPSHALKTVATRWRRGVYKTNRRPAEPTITDERGRVVRSIGKAQTFLNEGQVDELVVLYQEGLSLRELAEKFGLHHRTAAAHLVRRGEPLRKRQLSESQVAEAERLYQEGMPLLTVGRQLGVSQGMIRRALAARGVTIRPRGPGVRDR